MRHCWGTTTMPHTRSGHDQDRSRNMRTRNRRLGPLVQHPPPPLPGRHHTTTSRKSTHNNTKGSGLNKPPQNPGLDTPAKGHCTRYVALHPLRRAAPEQKGCNAYRSGAMPTHRVHDPPSQAQMRTCPNGGRRTRQAWLYPAANPQQPTGPSSGTPPDGQPGPAANPNKQQDPVAAHPPQPTGPGSDAPPTTNSARQRTQDSQPGPGMAGPDGPSRRRAERAARGADNERATERAARGAARHQARARRSRGVEARARGTHATSPGTTHAYDEAGTRRAKQRRGPRPRQQVRPGDPP